METESITSILICGGGVAGWMSAATLSRTLPKSIQITVLELSEVMPTDIFYGTVTSPKALAFHELLGLSEADLLLHTATGFSYGTHYKNWAQSRQSWTQCFHAPLPVLDGIPFDHHIKAADHSLFDYLISAMAAQAGRFAHPPADKQNPLSQAEYGYQFHPFELAHICKKLAVKNGVDVVSAPTYRVKAAVDLIQSIDLKNGQSLTADLYVDCSGPDADILSSLEPKGRQSLRSLKAYLSDFKSDRLGPPMRVLSSDNYGWQADTPLRGAVSRLTVCDPASKDGALAAHGAEATTEIDITTGHQSVPWAGNCVAIGHSAAVIEPITPAPMMLLHMDIERLLGLVPVTPEMSIERQTYNESAGLDIAQTRMFNAAFFQMEGLPEAPYWNAAGAQRVSDKLIRKLKQYEHRGILVSFDLEPFNAEDWTILHAGTGRTPRKLDPFAQNQKTKIAPGLQQMSHSANGTVAKMPPHHVYMAKYLEYLGRKHVSNL